MLGLPSIQKNSTMGAIKVRSFRIHFWIHCKSTFPFLFWLVKQLQLNLRFSDPVAKPGICYQNMHILMDKSDLVLNLFSQCFVMYNKSHQNGYLLGIDLFTFFLKGFQNILPVQNQADFFTFVIHFHQHVLHLQDVSNTVHHVTNKATKYYPQVKIVSVSTVAFTKVLCTLRVSGFELQTQR